MSTTIDDANAKIAWSGAHWKAVTATLTDDDKTPQYYDQTFHGSTANGEYCIIAWHGTDIAVYGARRANHGIYGVSVDGKEVQFYSGYSSADTFQQVLFATTGLQEGDHTIKLSNENARNTDQYPNYVWIDVDYAVFTGSLMDAAKIANGAPSTSSSADAPPPSSSFSFSSTTDAASSSNAPSSSTSGASSLSTSASASPIRDVSALPTSKRPNGVGGPTSHRAETSGTPVVPVTGESSSSASNEGQDEGSSEKGNKTTAIAVSVTIIVVAVVVIFTVAGLWYLRRRKRRREEQDEHNGLTLQSSWR